MPGNRETVSNEGDFALDLVTLALKLWIGESESEGGDLKSGLIREEEVDGREFSGLVQALTTDAHSFGFMNDRLELEVVGLELTGLPSDESSLFGDDFELNVTGIFGLDVYMTILASNWSIVEGKRCILPEKPLTTCRPALESLSKAFRIIVILSSVISSLFCSIICLAVSATRFPSRIV